MYVFMYVCMYVYIYIYMTFVTQIFVEIRRASLFGLSILPFLGIVVFIIPGHVKTWLE